MRWKIIDLCAAAQAGRSAVNNIIIGCVVSFQWLRLLGLWWVMVMLVTLVTLVMFVKDHATPRCDWQLLDWHLWWGRLAMRGNLYHRHQPCCPSKSNSGSLSP